MQISDFSSILEISVGLSLASAVSQSFFQNTELKIRNKLDEISSLSSSVNLSEKKRTTLARKTTQLKLLSREKSKELKGTSLNFNMVTLASIPVSTGLMFVGAIFQIESPPPFLIFLMFLLLIWGPFFALISWKVFRDDAAELLQNADEIIDEILGAK